MEHREAIGEGTRCPACGEGRVLPCPELTIVGWIDIMTCGHCGDEYGPAPDTDRARLADLMARGE